jgi:hypothetical protein
MIENVQAITASEGCDAGRSIPGQHVAGAVAYGGLHV